ncbi:3-hydroxyacyl-CoA dehydrogenase family protein [Cryptosporangium phraense]|uniref:3-hydroxyacyl-CoA dehydrogenase family protein n=1 Tax=Cryptosporangium phraense TaxID=2593070 RepID=UPI00197AC3DC|nr:3-hydroxyacyl-CoA dehydrogenase family protein [Cryptosporangium phraense]
MSRDFARIGIIGLGTLGAGLAEELARAGFYVVGVDIDSAARARVSVPVSSSVEVLSDVDLVIEAVPERLELKKRVFAELGSVVPPSAIVASAASALSVTELAVAAAHPHRVVGLHFLGDSLVEVVRTVFTDPEVVDDAVELLTGRLDRNPLVVGDRPGLITSSLLFAYLNQAVSFVESGYATRDDVDAAMRYGCGLPTGPLAVVDRIGLDTTFDVLTALYAQSGDRRHAPSPLLKQMIAGGLLGVKSGRGFYTYVDGSPVVDSSVGPEGVEARPVRTVGVVGSGTMATGIVEVFAKAGYPVIYVTRSDAKSAAVLAALTKSLDRAVAKGKLASSAEVLSRVGASSSYDDLADVDLVVEAVVEDLDVKRTLFETLDAVCKPGAVLATTTSSLPVIECATATKRPQDVVGLHFFNPAPVMKLVEVVSTVSTAPDVVATAHAVTGSLGKHPVNCRDRAGFIVNALLFPYLNDAVAMLDAHYADTDEIDTAVTLGFGYPMGPFALLDVVGLDVSLAIQKELHTEFHEPGFSPSPLLSHLVAAGYLGRKTQRGFRDYARK